MVKSLLNDNDNSFSGKDYSFIVGGESISFRFIYVQLEKLSQCSDSLFVVA